MKKLEDIPKKSVFKAPEGYFEQLPTVIQSRLTKEVPSPARIFLSYTLRFALPVLALIVAGILWFRPAQSIEDKLAEIDSDQIAFYLDDIDYVEDEQLESRDWTQSEIDALEEAVQSELDLSTENYDNILEELDLENL